MASLRGASREFPRAVRFRFTMNAGTVFPSDEPVLQWLLHVARRADEAVRTTKGFRRVDRQVWLRAECEVFELAERAHSEALLMPAD